MCAGWLAVRSGRINGGGKGLFAKLARSMPHIALARLRILKIIFVTAEILCSR